MSRFTDFRVLAPVSTSPSILPAIDWSSIGHTAPSPVAVDYKGPEAPLPEAEIVIFTWTDAEWSALDHVFLHGRAQATQQSSTLSHHWLQFSHSAPSSGNEGGKLWGYYQLVDVQGKGAAPHRVLLLKSDTHLAHPPWIAGLSSLVDLVAAAHPQRIYSVGTAGGADQTQRLGDVVITNSAEIQLKIKDNADCGYNGGTFACTNWFPDLSIVPEVQSTLLFPLSRVATTSALERVLEGAKRGRHKDTEQLSPFTLNDLVNSSLDPRNLGSPQVHNLKDKPLLTTDYYYIAIGNTNYAALEMDDAVIAHVAQQKKVDFVFIRNISDPLVPAKTPDQKPIPEPAREAWSSAIYDAYGLYTSFNGALAAWATIAAT